MGRLQILLPMRDYIRRKWWFLLLLAVMLGLNVWVWRQALMPLPAQQPSHATLAGAGTPAQTGSIALVKDVVEMLFWIVVGAVTVLTYIAAKKSILQPMRAEIFKAHLDEMRTILSMFVGKGETELREWHGLDKLLDANVAMMFDEYADTMFGIKTDPNSRPYGQCSIAWITKEAVGVADWRHESAERGTSSAEVRKRGSPAEQWEKYTHCTLCIPREYTAAHGTIERLLENPLLPTKCVELLTDYLSTVDKNAEGVRSVLIECAREMPTEYPTLDALRKASPLWINNRFVQQFIDLKPKAEVVISYVRSRFDVDNLLRP